MNSAENESKIEVETQQCTEFSSIQEYKNVLLQTTKSDFNFEPKRFDLEYQSKREFDPGSGRTLAACLTHASRADLCGTQRIKIVTSQ